MSYEKIQRFLNDTDNRLVVRLGIALFGIILGIGIVLLSLLFDKSSAAAIVLLVFGCIVFVSFLIAPAVWYGNEN